MICVAYGQTLQHKPMRALEGMEEKDRRSASDISIDEGQKVASKITVVKNGGQETVKVKTGAEGKPCGGWGVTLWRRPSKKKDEEKIF